MKRVGFNLRFPSPSHGKSEGTAFIKAWWAGTPRPGRGNSTTQK